MTAFVAVLLVVFLSTNQTLSWLLCFTLILMGFYPIVRNLGRGTIDIFEPINLVPVYFAFMMGIRGWSDLAEGSYFLQDYDMYSPYYHEVFSLVFFYSMIALGFLFIGYYSNLWRLSTQALPKFSFSWTGERVYLTMTFCILLSVGGMLSYAYFLSRFRYQGDLWRVMSNPMLFTVGEIEFGGGSLFTAFSKFAVLGLLVAFLYIPRREGNVVRFGFGLLFMTSIVTYFLGFGGGKANIFFPLLSVAACHHYCKKQWSLRRALLVGLVVLFVGIPTIGYYREYGFHFQQYWNDVVVDWSGIGTLLLPLFSRSIGADMFFIILDKTPSPFPFQYGGTMLRVFTILIPRQIWPNKPWSFGVDFNRIYLAGAGGTSSVAPSMIGELYLNFHVVGIILGFLAFGILLRTIYAYCITSPRRKEMVLLYAILLPPMLMNIEGPFADRVFFILMELFPFIVASFILRAPSVAKTGAAASPARVQPTTAAIHAKRPA